MKRNVFQDGNGSDMVMIEGLGMYVPMSQVRSMQAEIERLHSLAERMKQEAEGHAQEARTQRSTVHDIYQALGIQKGDWNGKALVVEKFAAVEQERDQLNARWARFNEIMGCIYQECDGGNEFDDDPIPAALWELWRSPETSLADHDAEVIERARDRVQETVGIDDSADDYNNALCVYIAELRQQAEEVQS